MTGPGRDASLDLGRVLEPFADEIVEVRHDIHAHPELSRQEFRTTKLIADRLYQDGLRPMLLPGGVGLICDIGDVRAPRNGATVALRADLDALPVQERADVPFRSQTDGVAHACGHDVHTSALLGAALALHRLEQEGRLGGAVRLIFQPAEEVNPGGALTVRDAGALDGIQRVYALHCDPSKDVGIIGSRTGAITSAVDIITVRLHGSGGHTSRPHLTEDVVFALAQVAVQTPAILSRRLDPRAGVAMVWGAINAGTAANAVPMIGELKGTLRCLDATAWATAGALVMDAVQEIVRPYGVRAEIEHARGIPPTVNDAEAVAIAEDAIRRELGERALELSEQSLGGEDFAWMLEKVPGAMLRLGVRTPGGATVDLHAGDFVADDRAVLVGALALTSFAVGDLDARGVVQDSQLRATPRGPMPEQPGALQRQDRSAAGLADVLTVAPRPESQQLGRVLDVDDPPRFENWSSVAPPQNNWAARHL